MDLQTVAAENLLMRCDRNVDLAIEGVAKKRTSRLFNTDYTERHSANLQSFRLRLSGKELVLDVVPRTHTSAERSTSSPEINGRRHRFVFDVYHVRRHAVDTRAGKFDSFLSEIRAALSCAPTSAHEVQWSRTHS
jgi:hypothetical protein